MYGLKKKGEKQWLLSSARRTVLVGFFCVSGDLPVYWAERTVAGHYCYMRAWWLGSFRAGEGGG